MRTSPGKLHVIAAALATCALLGVAGASFAQEAKLSGWYVGAGVGVSKTSGMKQAGWNRENTCYPVDDCSHLADGTPDGYRWYYDLDADDGAAFEISIGRAFETLRLELSFSQRKNDTEQKFTDITFFDGSRRVRAQDGNYESRSASGIDSLTTRTLSLDAYYDFSLAGSRFTPYVGAGVGVSFLKLAGLYFQSWYSCKNPAMDCDMPERYNGHQDTDLSDTVFSTHLHAGLDYRASERILLGLKLSYAMVGDMKDAKGEYLRHPASGVSNFTTISGMNHWSVMFGVKYFFGE